MMESTRAATAASGFRVSIPKVVMILLAQSSQALCFGAISLFLPLIRADLGISFAEAGFLAGVATFCYAAMQIPAGILADRFGAKALFVSGLIVINLLSISFSFLHSYQALLINQALSGAFRALIFAPGLMLMSAQFGKDRQSTASGVYIAGGFSSSILLNLMGPPLVGILGWRHLILAFAISGVAIVTAVALVRERAAPKPAKPPFAELVSLLKTSTIWWAGLVQFVRLSIVNALFFWLPSLLVADKGVTVQQAGFIVAISAAVTAPSNIVGGYLADRMAKPALLIMLSLAMMAFTILGLIFAHSMAVVVVLVAVNSIFVQAYFGPLFSLPIRAYGARYTGVLSGFGNLCANIGAFSFDIILGLVKQKTGSFTPGLVMLIILCGIGIIAAQRLGRAVTSAEKAGTRDAELKPSYGIEPISPYLPEL